MWLAVLSLALADPLVDNPAAALPAYGLDVAPIFAWPLSGTSARDWLAGGFMPRWKVSEERYDFHQGIDVVPRVQVDGVDTWMSQEDIAAAPPPVHAVADGVVNAVYPVGSANYPQSGNVLVIKHLIAGVSEEAENVYYTYYMHLNDVAVAEGAPVVQGQTVGHVGNTETLTSTLDFWHLHFEVRGSAWQFYAKNPIRYLPHTDDGGYAPQIVLADELPGTCATAFRPRQPRFAVRLRGDRDELDIATVAVTVTDLTTGAVDTQTVDFERRESLSDYRDRDHDGWIKYSAEYDPDALLDGVVPVYDACGALRNVFRTSSEAVELELLFEAMAGGRSVRIDAQVCDLYGSCESAEPVSY